MIGDLLIVDRDRDLFFKVKIAIAIDDQKITDHSCLDGMFKAIFNRLNLLLSRDARERPSVNQLKWYILYCYAILMAL